MKLAPRRGVAVLCFAAVACASVTAWADADSAAAAEQLFLEGRRLLDEGKYDEACPALARSQALDPSAGTLLNLADCLEKSGKLASAWSAFRDAARAASDRRRPDWENLAIRRAAALEARLSFLVIRFAGAPPAGLRISCAGADLPLDALGAPLPKDAGTYVVSASAPGRQTWRSTVELRAAKRMEVVVPPLAEAAPQAPTAAPPPSWWNPQRVVGVTVGIAGVAGFGAGTIFGLLAKSSLDDAKAGCATYPVLTDPGCRSATVRDANDDAQRLSSLSTVGFVAGGTLVAAGLLLVLTGGRSPATGATSITPLANAHAAGLGVVGAL